MAPLVVTKLSIRLSISQAACSVRPVEEQPPGLDTITDLSLYAGAGYNYHKPSMREKQERVVLTSTCGILPSPRVS